MEKLILLIEDSTDLRENLAELLAFDGYKVITANNGLQGLNIAAKLLPDLIVCDILMPGLDGYEVFSALAKNPKTSGIPFIFATAKSENADKQKARELGATNYIVKPFTEAELLDCIEKSLELIRDIGNISTAISSPAVNCPPKRLTYKASMS
jgi:CheY-like chemotaxis protein